MFGEVGQVGFIGCEVAEDAVLPFFGNGHFDGTLGSWFVSAVFGWCPMAVVLYGLLLD